MTPREKKGKKHFLELCDQYAANLRIRKKLLEKFPSLQDGTDGFREALQQSRTQMFAVVKPEYYPCLVEFDLVSQDISYTEHCLDLIEQKFGHQARFLIESLYLEKIPVRDVAKKMNITERTVTNRVTRYLSILEEK